MSKGNNYSQNTIPTHLEDDVLIAYLDGELPEEEKNLSSRHLEDCWACRGNLKAIQDSIDNFMIQRDEILFPPSLPPSEPAFKIFQSRLEKFKTQPRTTSVLSSWRTKAENFVSKFRLLFSSPGFLRTGIAVVAIVVIGALLLNQITAPIVSAAELLENTEAARKSALTGTADPVIHQKIQVRRSKNNSQIDSVNWETWEDSNENSFREAVETEGTRQFIADKYHLQTKKVSGTAETLRPVLLTELGQILQLNHMNPNNPLTAGSFRGWRDSLQEKTEEVTKTSSNDGDKSFALRVAPLGEVNNGQITNALYSVRANDWSPLELRFEVKAPDGTISFEIIPQTSEILARSELSPEIFPGTRIANVPNLPVTPGGNLTPAGSPEIETTENVNANVNVNSSTAPVENKTRGQASAELEVEVLQILNQIKADMGEQIEIKRTADGFLLVSGLVDDTKRKTEILNALNPVANNPSVKIEILTIDEAVAKKKQNKESKAAPVTNVEGVEVETLAMPAEPQLREYFGRQGGNIDDAVRNYAIGRNAQSRQAMQHLGALKKLAGQFTTDQLKALSPEAREKWLALIRSHARAFQEQSAALRRELKPVFFAGAGEGGGKGGNISNETEMINAIRRLYENGAANDSIIRSAFTVSGRGGFSAIASPQFWQSLKDAEAAAQRIQNFR